MNVPPFQPRRRPHPRPRPSAPASPPAGAAAARPGWGWVEWFLLSQTMLQSLLFVPGLSSATSPVRFLVRVFSYLMAVIAWWFIWQKGEASTASKFPPRAWLIGVIVWMTLSLAHPNTYSLPAALAQIMLYVAVLSPAFWVPEALKSPRQLVRIVAVLFFCNALSASLGLAQVFSDRFYPPYIPEAYNQFEGENAKIQVAGRGMIFRPCGLTDTPGAAAPAGATAALFGLAFALRPIGVLRRSVCAGLGFASFAVIYYTQVRSSLLVLGISLITLTALLSFQGRLGNAMTLLAGAVGMVAGSFWWVARRLGSSEVSRFGKLFSSGLAESIERNRGGFLYETLTDTIWVNPLGHGLGWWGMTHMMFRNPARLSPVWVEIMVTAWVIDGGFPLLILYGGAMLIAVYGSLRIALKSKDPDVSFWASVVVAQNISTLALCCSYPVFVSPVGQVFWLLNAAVYAADVRSRGQADRPQPAAVRTQPRGPRPMPWRPGQAPT